MNVVGTYAITSSGQLNINSTTGGTPVAKMTIGGTLSLATGTIRIGNSTVNGATDILAVTGNTTMTSGTFTVCANNGTNTNNAFIETGTFTESGGTATVSTNTGGSATNSFIVNSSASPAFTLSVGTFSLCSSTTATATLVNVLKVAGGYSQTSGTFYGTNAAVTGTYLDTVNIAGTATISAGAFTCANNFGTPRINFNNTSASCLTLSGTGIITLIGSANAGNVTITCAGSFTNTSTSTFAIAFESVSSTAGVAVLQVNGNFTYNSTGGYNSSWGNGEVTGNYMGITGNLSIAGAGNVYGGGVPTTNQATGFLFNGSGTSSSPQTISVTSSTALTNISAAVNSGTYVKLISNIALPAFITPYSCIVVNSGGTLDCSTYTISGGSAAGTLGLNVNGTLASAHASGITGSVTAAPAIYSSGANFIFNGSSAQTTGTAMPSSCGSLTINNSSGVTLSQAETLTGNLTFTSGILNTDIYSLSMPGASTVTGAGASAYVKGTLSKTISGLSTVNYQIGDNNYAPVSLALTGASAGSISAYSTYGDHPNAITSGFVSPSYVSHYWTLASSGATLTTITPTFTYNLSDIVGGSNTGFVTQKYASSAWLTTPYTNTNTSAPYTSAPSGVSSGAFTGDYIVGLKYSPALYAASGATVDNPFSITFTDNPTWRAAITQVKLGTNVLPGGAYSISTAGQITFTPSASAFLQVPGTYNIIVSSPGFVPDTVSQVIGAGAVVALHINTNPGNALYNGGPVSAQPVISLRDQYNNTTSDTFTVTAAVATGAWTVGGTYNLRAVSGITTFTNVSATAATSLTGVTMSFNCPGHAFSTVTSSGFNIPSPSPTLIAASSPTVDAPFAVTFTEDYTWRHSITSITIGSHTLPTSSYDTTVSGQITFNPATTAFLDTSGTFTITVNAGVYGADPVIQYIGPGVATHLAITTQPVPGTTNPGLFGTQPVVALEDQYNNIASTSSTTISATATGATWSVSGTTSASTTAGVLTYTDMQASSTGYATGATISFGASGYSTVVSNTFNVPFPYGTFTYGTGGTFPTLDSAVRLLNTVSFGGPIILNAFSAGWTETAPVGGYQLGSTLMNASLNATNTLTINGYPGGANTVITAPVGTGTNDFIFAIKGSDYVTISGVDIQESGANTTTTTQMEYGYVLLNATTSDGCQNDKIKSCNITLNNTNTNGTYGISSFHVNSSFSTVTPSVVADLHSSNKFYKNTITNCQYPIYLSGYNAGSPYTLYDQNNDVGGSSSANGNTATNWGATGSVPGKGMGVALIYQNNANASYNTMNNASGGSANVHSLYGVFCKGVNSTFTANYNVLTLAENTGSASDSFAAIHAESSGSNLTASNNTIVMTETSGSNVYTNGIYSAPLTGNNFTAKNNNVAITMSISGGSKDLSGIYCNSNGVSLIQYDTVTITNSGVTNSCITSFIRLTGGTGGSQTMSYNRAIGTNINTSNNLAGFGNTVNATSLKVDNNYVNITSVATVGTIAVGIANSGFNTVQEMNNNNMTITANSFNTGIPAGIYNSGGATTSLDCNNDTITVTTNNASGIGIYNANTTTIATASFNNNVITANASAAGTASMSGIYNNGGLMTTQSISNNNITVNTYAGGGIVYGISEAAGTVATATLSNNTITCSTTTGSVNGIYTVYDASIFTLNINSNTIDLSMSGASAANVNYIYYNPSAAITTGGTQNINYNVFKSASGFPSNTGSMYFIESLGSVNSTNNIIGNTNTGSINKTGNGGAFYGIYSRGATLILGTTTITNNSFSNINVGSTNATAVWGILSGWNTGIPQNISNNSFNNITCGTSSGVMIQVSTYGLGSTYNYNTMSNVTSNGATLYGIAVSTVGSGGTGTAPGTVATASGFGGTFRGNKIYNFSDSNVSGIIYPIHYWYSTSAASSAFTFNQDTVYNITVTGAGSPGIYGIYQMLNVYSLILYSTVSNCVFHDFTSTNSAASPTITGMYFTRCDTNTIYNNILYNLGAGSSTSATAQVVGINVLNSGTSGYYNIYNNSFRDFTAAASNNPNSIIGINLQSATLNYWNLYHNTIAFGGLGVGSPGTAITSSSTNFGAAGVLFAAVSSSVLTLKDNIIYMNVNPKGTGISSCIQRNVTGTAGTAPSSSLFIPNYNIYYTNSGASAGTTPNNYLYVDDITGGSGTPINGYALNGLTGSITNNIVNDVNLNSCAGVSYTTSYKAFVGGGNETFSYTECDLTSSGFPTGSCGPSGASFAYQNGLAITSPSITTDLSGATRATPPCRGANEFSGSSPTTGAPPVISYTNILSPSYCITSPPTLTATITSAAGINITAGTKPRLYYKGSSDANIYATANNNSVDGWKYVEATNGSSPFIFQPDYTLLYNTAAATTTISYFVVAQDISSPALVAYNSVGLAVGYCPSSVALASGAFPVLASPTINSYLISSRPTFTTSVAPTYFYGSASAAVLTLSPSNNDLGLQWKMNYTIASGTTGFYPISGATSNNYNAAMPDGSSSPALLSPGTAGNVSFKAILTCSSSAVDSSAATSVTDFTPMIVSTTDSSRCGTGTVTLSATGSTGSTVNWYAAASGGSILATGNTYSPSVSTTTVFYVSDSFGNYGNQSIGKANVTGSGTVGGPFLMGTGYSGDGLFFKAFKEVKINSIAIYPESSGLRFK